MRDKAFNIAKNPNYDGYQRWFYSVIYNFFHKKTSGRAVKKEIISNKELSQELHKPIIRRFKKTKVNWSFLDNIWGAHFADMQVISKFNKRNLFSILCNWYLEQICMDFSF